MKHKEDIYKAPKKFISEYFAGILVVILTTLFLGFEIFSFYTSEDNSSTPLLAGQESNHTFPRNPQDTNNTIQSPKEKELVAVTEQAKVKTQKKDVTGSESAEVEEKDQNKTTAETQKAMIVASNPLKKILATTNESDAWELQQTYSDYSDAQKEKLLNHAVFNNHANNLEKMLDAGYEFSTPHYAGDTNKLIFARKYQVVILLINRGLVDVFKANKYGYTLLHEASAKGHSELIKLLVSKGVDINAQARSGASALHYPTRYGYGITVGTLLELGIDPDLKATLNYGSIAWNQTTALQIAARRGHTALVKKLLDAGADPLLKDANGLTALDFAKQFQHNDIAELLETEVQSDESNTDQNVTQEESDSSNLDGLKPHDANATNQTKLDETKVVELNDPATISESNTTLN